MGFENDEVFFQKVPSILTPEQSKSIEDLKSIEPAYADYSNEQIQKFINSKIPDSKVKDIVYHVSEENITQFEFNKKRKDGRKTNTQGFHFTGNQANIEYYSINKKYGDKVIPVILNFKNPFIDNSYNKDIEYLNKSKFPNSDSAIMYQDDPDVTEWVAFEPSQITILSNEKTISEFKKFVDGNNIQSQKSLVSLKQDLQPNKILPAIIKKLNKTGLASEVVLLNNDDINQKLQEFGADITTTTTGFVDNSTNTIYLNTDNPNIEETLLHEHGHLYLNFIKQNDPLLYALGLEKAQTSEALPYITYVKETQPNLVEGTEAFQNEVLAQVIGDNGAKLLVNNNENSLRQWLSDLWNSIKKVLGLSKYTGEQVRDMTLKQYADAINVDLLSGQNINDLFNSLLRELSTIIPPFNGIQLTTTAPQVAARPRVVTPFGIERDNRKKIFKKEFSERTAEAILSKLSASMDNDPKLLIAFLKTTIPIASTMVDVINNNGAYLQKMFEKSIGEAQIVKEESTLRPEDLLNQVNYRFNVETDKQEARRKYLGYYKNYNDDVDSGEAICTLLRGDRFNESYITFFVKDDAKETPHANDLTQANITEKWASYLEEQGRKNSDGTFNLEGIEPESLDPYSTSVISVQISKAAKTLKAISRYNHTLGKPDHIYKNLDNIIAELHDSFYKFFDVIEPLGSKSDVSDGYILNGEGQLFKVNGEDYGVYYGEGFYIKSNGTTVILDPATQIMGDYYLFDTKNQTVTDVIDLDESHILGIEKKDTSISLKFIKSGVVKITGEFETEIEIKDGYLHKLKSTVVTIGDFFLYKNTSLVSLDLPNNETIGLNFLSNNILLANLNLPNNIIIGDKVLQNNDTITELNLPSNTSIGDNFLGINTVLRHIHLPNNISIGNNFLPNNNSIREINLSNNLDIGDFFLLRNTILSNISLPKNKKIDNYFLANNNKLKRLNLPSNETIGYKFLINNQSLEEINIPNNKQIGTDFLTYNNSGIKESIRYGSKPLSEEEFNKLYEAEIQNGKDIDNNRIQSTLTFQKSNEELLDSQIETLRSQEQLELKSLLPSGETISGKIERDDVIDKVKFDKVYDKYDKLITPLLKQQEPYKVSDNSNSLYEVTKISNSSHPLNKLAKLLIPYVAKNSVPVTLEDELISKHVNDKGEVVDLKADGVYYRIENNIKIDRNSIRQEVTMLHEAIHSLVILSSDYRNPDSRMNEVYKEVQKQVPNYESIYGLSNIDEFVVAIFVDSKVIKLLQTLEPTNNKFVNLFEEVYDYIVSLFKITKKDSLYNEAFSAASNVVQEGYNFFRHKNDIKRSDIFFDSDVDKLSWLNNEIDKYGVSGELVYNDNIDVSYDENNNLIININQVTPNTDLSGELNIFNPKINSPIEFEESLQLDETTLKQLGLYRESNCGV
jgi:hypothetical protein